MTTLLSKLQEAIGGYWRFNGSPAVYQPCPNHLEGPRALQVFPEVPLFRCHRCGECWDTGEFLDQFHQHSPQILRQAFLAGLVEHEPLDDPIKRLRNVGQTKDALDRGRKAWGVALKLGTRWEIFGDVAVFGGFEVPLVIPKFTYKIRAAEGFLVRTIRNAFGRCIRYQVIWHSMCSRVYYPLQKEPERGFLFPRWADFRGVDEVVIAAHERLALAASQAMAKWPAERRLPIISLIPDSAPATPLFRSPYSRIWFLLDSVNDLHGVLGFWFPRQTEISVKMVSEEPEEAASQLEQPDQLFANSSELFRFIEERASGLPLRDAVEFTHANLKLPDIPGPIADIFVKTVSDSSKIPLEMLTEHLDPVPGSFSVETEKQGILCCRRNVYYQKRNKRSLRPVSNFCVRIVERFMRSGKRGSGGRVHWKLRLIIGTVEARFEVSDSVLNTPIKLWNRVCAVAAGHSLPPPEFTKMKLKVHLPALIRRSYALL